MDGGSREEEFAPSSPNENEFVSDSFQGDEISQEDLKKEMQMLGVDDSKSETKTEKEEGLPLVQTCRFLMCDGVIFFFFLISGRHSNPLVRFLRRN